MGKRNVDFEKAKVEYYKKHKHCIGEKLIPEIKCLGVMSIHHAKGRKGELLTDERYFRMLCRKHHDWVHRNNKEAIETKDII